jgi:diaminopimelate epimerase
VAPPPVNDTPAVKGTRFYKMSGSGNDFVVLDGRSVPIHDWSAGDIQLWCDRRNGVGADGLVLLTPAPPEGLRMTYWNADGSRGAMCGNAALCCGRLAVTLGMVPAGQFCLQTDAGGVMVRVSDEKQLVQISLPDFDLPRPFTEVPLAAGERWMMFAAPGVPHLVIGVDDVEVVDPAARGRALRYHPSLGPAGANVNFVAPSPSRRPQWLIRTYERGVEAETLACGTGTAAAALCLATRGEGALPMVFQSRGGPELRVSGALGPALATNVWLGGEGRLIYEGMWKARVAE